MLRRLLLTRQAVWGTVFLSLGAGLLMLHKARFAPKLRYGMDVALLTFAVVAVPGAAGGSSVPWE